MRYRQILKTNLKCPPKAIRHDSNISFHVLKATNIPPVSYDLMTDKADQLNGPRQALGWVSKNSVTHEPKTATRIRCE